MKNLKYILLILTFLALIVSYIGAKEPFTWWLEVSPVFVGILFLAIFRKFEFTNFVYVVIFLHFLVLIIGGHYTYADVPFLKIGEREIIMINWGILCKVFLLL